MKHLLITGGAGFIGSALCRVALQKNYKITVLDALTYAGNLHNIEELIDGVKCRFQQGDICDEAIVNKIFTENQFDGVLHLAAESHVDNSISGPKPFITTNIGGTFTLLEGARAYWQKNKEKPFRFVHVSTDEVYGSLGSTGYFTEESNYAPNSPYSASKAASDLLARAWFHTYGLPTLITNCSNNYGPRQFPEKLIPLMIQNALQGKKLPVYGKGENIRDWIHVEDHAAGILLAFENGKVGEKYCFGGNAEFKNIDLVKTLCSILDRMKPRENGESYSELIQFVVDRPGHDLRYAIDDSFAKNELGYTRKFKSFEFGLEETVKWYLNHSSWTNDILGRKR